MTAEVRDLISLGFKPKEASHLGYNGGWVIVNEVWTVASASTITVPTGAASRYQIGDKVLLLNNSAYKFFYITGVADALLAVSGGSNYALVGAAGTLITNIYVSRDSSALGFPTAFAWAPALTGWSSPPTGVYRFSLSEGKAYCSGNQTSDGTNNATTITMGLPVAARTEAGMVWANGIPYAINGGTGIYTAMAYVGSGATTAIFYSNGSGGAWSDTGVKRLYWFQFEYEY